MSRLAAFIHLLLALLPAGQLCCVDMEILRAVQVLVKIQWLIFVVKRLIMRHANILAVICSLSCCSTALFHTSFTTTHRLYFQANIAISHNSVVLLGKDNYVQC